MAQDENCYQSLIEKGTKRYQLDDFDGAIVQFEAALGCPSLTSDQEKSIQQWLDKAKTGYIDAILAARQETAARARAAENIALALQTAETNPTMALRIAEYNYLRHPNNDAAATALRQIISNPAAAFYSESKPLESLFYRSMAYSPGGDSIFITANRDFKVYSTAYDSLVHAQTFGYRTLTTNLNIQGDIIRLEGREVFLYFQTGDSTSFSLGPDIVIDENYDIRLLLSAIGKYVLLQSNSSFFVFDYQGKCIYRKKEKKSSWSTAVISGAAKRIAYHSKRDSIYVRHWENNQSWTIPAPGGINRTLAFSPDGRILAIEDPLRQGIGLWSAEGQLLNYCFGYNGKIKAIQFSPDKRHLLALTDSEIQVWTIVGQPLAKIKYNDFDIIPPAFHPTMERIAGFIGDELIYWDFSGWEVRPPIMLNSPIFDAVSTLDGRELAVGTYDKLIKFYRFNGEKMELIKSIYYYPEQHSWMKYYGDYFVLYTNQGFEIINNQAQETYAFQDLPFKEKNLIPLNFETPTDKNGNRLRRKDGGPIYLLDAESSPVLIITDFTKYKAVVTPLARDSLAINHGEKQLVLSLRWSSVTRQIEWDDAEIYISPTGRHVLIKDEFEEICLLWNTETQDFTQLDTRFSEDEFQMLTDDGAFISYGEQGGVYQWNQNGIPIFTFPLEGRVIKKVINLPKQDYLILISEDGMIQYLWKLESFLEQRVVDIPMRELVLAGMKLEHDDMISFVANLTYEDLNDIIEDLAEYQKWEDVTTLSKAYYDYSGDQSIYLISYAASLFSGDSPDFSELMTNLGDSLLCDRALGFFVSLEEKEHVQQIVDRVNKPDLLPGCACNLWVLEKEKEVETEIDWVLQKKDHQYFSRMGSYLKFRNPFIKFKQQEIDLQIKVFKRALELCESDNCSPNDIASYFEGLTFAYLLNNQLELAQQTYEKGLQEVPENPLLTHLYPHLLLFNGEIDEAFQFYEDWEAKPLPETRGARVSFKEAWKIELDQLRRLSSLDIDLRQNISLASKQIRL